MLNDILSELLRCGWSVDERDDGLSAHRGNLYLRVPRAASGRVMGGFIQPDWCRARLDRPDVDGNGIEFCATVEYTWDRQHGRGLAELLAAIRAADKNPEE